MSFQEKYPNLYQFFGAYFPDADLFGLTDKEVVANYITDCSEDEFRKTKIELAKIIDDDNNYWQTISCEANRYFENNENCLDWLKMVQIELSKDEKLF